MSDAPPPCVRWAKEYTDAERSFFRWISEPAPHEPLGVFVVSSACVDVDADGGDVIVRGQPWVCKHCRAVYFEETP